MHFTRTSHGEQELATRSIPLSVPERRLLGFITKETSATYLARKVRLGELERHLLHLARRGLIEIVVENGTADGSDVPTVVIVPTPETLKDVLQPLFAVLDNSALAAVKQNAKSFVRMRAAFGIETGIAMVEAADSQEALLVALGAVQRELFDLLGRESAAEFFEQVVAPTFYS